MSFAASEGAGCCHAMRMAPKLRRSGLEENVGRRPGRSASSISVALVCDATGRANRNELGCDIIKFILSHLLYFLPPPSVHFPFGKQAMLIVSGFFAVLLRPPVPTVPPTSDSVQTQERPVFCKNDLVLVEPPMFECEAVLCLQISWPS